MKCRGIRGAITVEEDSPHSIINATKELLRNMIEENRVNREDIAFILFTTTPDLKSAFPAAAAREMGMGRVPLMCAQEIDVPGSLRRCIRILMLVNTERGQDEIKHIYLREAKILRPDLEGK